MVNTTVKELMALGIPTNVAVKLHDKFVDEGDEAGTASVIATGTTTSRLLADRFGDVFNVKDFGAVGNSTGVSGNGTDDTTAIQRALNAARDAGGGIVYFPKGIYRRPDTANKLLIYSNTTMEGDGDCSVLFHDDTVANPRRDLLEANSVSNVTFRNFKILGTAATYMTETNNSQCLGGTGITNLRVENVTFEGMRYMSTAFTQVNSAVFIGCRLYRCMRDGIRCTQSQNIVVTGCTLESVADDCIALHSVDSATAPPGSGFVVTNNVVTSCQNIKILGGKRVVVSGNTITRGTRGAINIGLVNNGPEGASPSLDVTVSNNVIQDTFGSLGRNSTIAIDSLPYTTSLGAVQPGVNSDPKPYNWLQVVDTVGATNAGVQNVRVENNTITATLPTTGVSTYSDYGYGLLYDRVTPWGTDPAITATSFSSHAIVVYGAVRGLRIAGNMISGLGTGVNAILLTTLTASSYPDFIDAVIEGNIIHDVPSSGISIIGGDANAARNLIIRNNVIDSDPYFRNSAHNADNTWTSGTAQLGIQTNGTITGSVITGNWFAHCASSIGPNTSPVAYVQNNYILCDPNSIADDALNKGVRALSRQHEFIHIKYNGDPTSATFGEIANMPLSAAGSIPTTGWYGAGHMVKNGSMTVAAGKVLIGWARLTTGTGHVSGTDWTPLYCTNS
jgi:hypothetical protein